MSHSYTLYRKKSPIVRAYRMEETGYIDVDEEQIIVPKGDYVVHSGTGTHVFPAAIFENLFEKIEPHPSVSSYGHPKE